MLLHVALWLAIGVFVGWLATVVMNDAGGGIVTNAIVAVAGAALAGALISPLVGIPGIQEGVVSLGSIMLSVVGAILLLALVLFIRGSYRRTA